jgi:hypothetical protein
MALILGFDPGGCTGVAIAEHSSGRDFQLVQSLEYPWIDRFKIFNLIYSNRTRIKAVVVETYRLFANELTLHSQVGSEIPSARVIGIVELSAKICKLDCLYFQDPGRRLEVSLLPEHKKLIGRSTKYPNRQSEHCLSAYLHLRYHILTTARKKA